MTGISQQSCCRSEPATSPPRFHPNQQAIRYYSGHEVRPIRMVSCSRCERGIDQKTTGKTFEGTTFWRLTISSHPRGSSVIYSDGPSWLVMTGGCRNNRY